VKPRDVGTGFPSHVGGECVVTYAGIPTPVDGRVKAIILALLRDAHRMHLDELGALRFTWGSDMRWHIEIHSEPISEQETA
jgi:hypothetical protein